MANEDAFREFVTARWASMVRRAYLLTGDHGRAEDLVQSTLERMHKHWRRIERKDAPDAYALKVMTNLAISNSRRRRFREVPAVQAPEPVFADVTGGVDDRDEIWRALDGLPPKMRAVLVLRYLDDLTEAEAARVLGCSVGTIKSQSSRGLARLRQVIPESGEDPPARPSVLPPRLTAPTVEGTNR